jgi:phosphatidylglycerophosphate synthase
MTIAIISWTGFPVTLVIPTLAYVLYDLGGEYIRRKYQRAGHNMEAPNWFARKKTLIQMGAILSMLVGLAHTGPNAETFFSFGSALYTIGVGFLAVSAYHYVMAAARVGLIRLPFMPAMF